MSRFRAIVAASTIVLTSAVTPASAFADPMKGSPIDVFGGAVSTRAADKVIDMLPYCRATLDIVLTGSFVGTVSFDGNSGGNVWFKDAPELGQVVNFDGTIRGHTFSAHQPPGAPMASWTQVQSYTFTATHRYLRIVLRSITSGAKGGTIRAIVTPLPC